LTQIHQWLAGPAFFGRPGPGSRQIAELSAAFALAEVDDVSAVRQLYEDPD
jgi:hypothetical protein